MQREETQAGLKGGDLQRSHPAVDSGPALTKMNPKHLREATGPLARDGVAVGPQLPLAVLLSQGNGE